MGCRHRPAPQEARPALQSPPERPQAVELRAGAEPLRGASAARSAVAGGRAADATDSTTVTGAAVMTCAGGCARPAAGGASVSTLGMGTPAAAATLGGAVVAAACWRSLRTFRKNIAARHIAARATAAQMMLARAASKRREPPCVPVHGAAVPVSLAPGGIEGACEWECEWDLDRDCDRECERDRECAAGGTRPFCPVACSAISSSVRGICATLSVCAMRSAAARARFGSIAYGTSEYASSAMLEKRWFASFSRQCCTTSEKPGGRSPRTAASGSGFSCMTIESRRPSVSASKGGLPATRR